MKECAARVLREMLDTYTHNRIFDPSFDGSKTECFSYRRLEETKVVDTMTYGGEIWAIGPSTLCNVTRLKNQVYTIHAFRQKWLRSSDECVV